MYPAALIYGSGIPGPSIRGVIYLHRESAKPLNAAALVELLKSLRNRLLPDFMRNNMCIIKSTTILGTWLKPFARVMFQRRPPNPYERNIRNLPKDIVQSLINPRLIILPDWNITDLTTDDIEREAGWLGLPVAQPGHGY